LDHCTDDTLFEIYTNGLGLDVETTERFKSVVETANRQGSFLSSMQWNPSNSFCTLPFLWLRSKGWLHYYADVCNSTTIIAHELGFKLPIDDVNTCSWTFNKSGSTCTLEYCKLIEVVDGMAPTNGGGEALHSNFHAMVDFLYSLLNNDALKSIYTDLVYHSFASSRNVALFLSSISIPISSK